MTPFDLLCLNVYIIYVVVTNSVENFFYMSRAKI